MSAAAARQRSPAREPDPIASAFEVRSAPIAWRRVWGTALTTALCYLLGVVTGHLHWGAWAFFGGFASFYVAGQPYRQRAQVLCAAVLGLAAAMLVGGVATAWWATAPVLGAVAAVATYLAGRFRVPLPSGLMFILVACLSAALPHSHLPARVLLVLVGGAIAWLVGMSGWPLRPHAPEAARVRDAYRAVAACLGHWSEQRGLALQNHAAVAVAAGLAATARGARRDARQAGRLSALARQAEAILLAGIALASERRTPLPPAARRAIARFADPPHPDAPQRAPAPAADVLGLDHDRWEKTPVGAHFRRVATAPAGSAVGLPASAGAGSAVASVLRPAPLVPFGALRIGVAVAASVVIAHLLRLSHLYWVPLTCAAVLQGETVLMLTRRAIQRLAGTVAGLLLAGVLIAGLHVAPVLSLALVVALQAMMLMVIAKNYAIAVAFVTAFAFLILNVSSPGPALPLVLARLRDTLLGVAVALAATYLLWPRVSAKRLPAAVAALIGRAEDVFDHLARHGRTGDQEEEPAADGRPGGSAARARRDAGRSLRAALQGEILYADALARDAQAELPLARGVEPLLPALDASERLGYLLLAAEAAGVDLQADEATAGQVRAILHARAADLAGGRPGGAAELAVPDTWPPLARELKVLAGG